MWGRTMVSKPLTGVGRIVQEDTVLGERVAYRLVVAVDGGISGRVDVDRTRVVQMIRSVAANGEPLALELEDGQRLKFAFRNTAGSIASLDDQDD